MESRRLRASWRRIGTEVRQSWASLAETVGVTRVERLVCHHVVEGEERGIG